MKPILIMGLPGSGKTTLARELAHRFNAVHWNADEVRQTINVHLTFDPKDRIKQAETMKFLAEKVNDADQYCVVDFVCPTKETRAAFGDAFVVWVDRIKEGRFEDTNQLFQPPDHYDIRVTDDGADAETWADDIQDMINF